MAEYRSQEGLEPNSFANIIELLNAMQGQSRERRDYYDTKVGKEILAINKGVNEAQNISSLDSLVNIINSNTSSYATNNANKYASQIVHDKAIQKRAEIGHYRKRIDNMQNKYFGIGDEPGFENVEDLDILNWDYEFLSDELMSIKDFESVFFEDYEKQHPVKFTYNPSKIRTGDLRRRVEAYKNNIYTALESLKGDNLISDYELPFVISGDKAGLNTSRVHYSKFYTKQFNNNNRAIGAIKGNIAKLKDYIIRETIKAGKKGKGLAENPDLVNSEQAYIQSGINLHEQFGTIWETDIKLQESEEKESYVNRMVMETIPKKPEELVRQFTQEIQGYEGKNKIYEREFYKWMGEINLGLKGFIQSQQMKFLLIYHQTHQVIIILKKKDNITIEKLLKPYIIIKIENN
jgi:hypothetical protein